MGCCKGKSFVVENENDFFFFPGEADRFIPLLNDGNIRLWIDPVDFLIHKKVYYNKKSEVSREATFSDLIEYEGLKFYKKESIYNIRKETTVEMSLKEFEKTTFDNLDKFNTPLKK